MSCLATNNLCIDRILPAHCVTIDDDKIIQRHDHDNFKHTRTCGGPRVQQKHTVTLPGR